MLIDAFSKWIEIVPEKHPDGITVAKAPCKYIVPQYDIPQIIWKTRRNLGIQRKHFFSYHPQSAGLVKRANGTVKSRLKSAWLSQEVLGQNVWTYRANKLSPFEILYSRPFKPVLNRWKTII